MLVGMRTLFPRQHEVSERQGEKALLRHDTAIRGGAVEEINRVMTYSSDS